MAAREAALISEFLEGDIVVDGHASRHVKALDFASLLFLRNGIKGGARNIEVQTIEGVRQVTPRIIEQVVQGEGSLFLRSEQHPPAIHPEFTLRLVDELQPHDVGILPRNRGSHAGTPTVPAHASYREQGLLQVQSFNTRWIAHLGDP